MNHAKEMAKVAYDALQEKKGMNLVILDISQASTVADYFIIATGSNTQQVNALVDNVDEQMHKNGFAMKQREGGNNSPWVLLDYTDVIVHVFDHENRGYYHLEDNWKTATEVDREEL